MRSLSKTPLLLTILVLGYVFLYVPIVCVVFYSFNVSRSITLWEGFSLKWYYQLLHNPLLLHAAWVSIKVAALSATFAVILGVLCAVLLTSKKRTRSQSLLELMVAAPLIMPEVITGLALLLLFVTFEQAIGWPKGRSAETITLAHTTLALSYVTLIIRARLQEVDPSIGEAACDLGARPLKIFLTITLPIIAPSLAAGWLLAFALSLDDLVLASFTSGPGATTLPMMIFSSLRFGVTPEINALATIMIVIVCVAVVAAGAAGALIARRGLR